MQDFLSSNIKFLRTKYGESQAGLGSKLNKAHTTIGNWEKGLAQPSLAEMGVIARIFDVSPNDLLFTDLSKANVIDTSGSTKNVQKANLKDKSSGSQNAFTTELAEPAQAYTTGQKAVPADAADRLFIQLIEEMRQDRKILLQVAASAQAGIATADELLARIEASDAMWQGLQALMLQYLSSLANKPLSQLQEELENKVAEAAGLSHRKGRDRGKARS